MIENLCVAVIGFIGGFLAGKKRFKVQFVLAPPETEEWE